jgi:hypothetical protein
VPCNETPAFPSPADYSAGMQRRGSGLPTRDRDLRRLVHRRLLGEHGRNPEAVVTDELSICRARARVDVAVVNGSLAGFELKSDVDRLGRLASQVVQYSRVFDEMTLVCAPRHECHAIAQLPDWWSIWLASDANAQLVEVRSGSRNPEVCSRSLAGLLWRDEMLACLVDHNLSNGLNHKPRRQLIDALVSNLGSEVLASEVRCRLRERLRRAKRNLTSGLSA